MESSIQKLAVIAFFVIGLSHIIQPRVWAQFFIRCSDKVGDGKGRASRLKLMCENQLPPTTLRRDH